MSTDVETLKEMGFSENRAQKALAKTNYSGVPAAMDWLLAHENDPDIDEEFKVPEGHTLGEPGSQPVTEDATMPEGQQPEETPVQAKSLKCDDCGRLLKSEDEVQLHATRTGHSNFSESVEEIKPLTEEEKQEQLARVQELMKQKRVEREEKEKQEHLEREKQRRVHGKEMTHVKQKMQDDEMKKIMEERRREKEEEKKARQRVREQIEKDKLDRAAKFGMAQPAATSHQPPTAVSPPSQSAASVATMTSASSSQPKEYKETNLQIRLFSGETVTQKFGVLEPLAAVRLFVYNKMTAGQFDGDFTSFSFSTTFPRRVFSEDDMGASLSHLGLVPSAVLILTRPPKDS